MSVKLGREVTGLGQTKLMYKYELYWRKAQIAHVHEFSGILLCYAVTWPDVITISSVASSRLSPITLPLQKYLDSLLRII
jgi:hypothetical protein